MAQWPATPENASNLVPFEKKKGYLLATCSGHVCEVRLEKNKTIRAVFLHYTLE